MVCKSLERQMSYFCGLNGSFDVLMLEKEKKQTERKSQIKGTGGTGLCQMNDAGVDLPTGSCPVTSKYNVLPHNHWQPKTVMTMKQVYLKLRMCFFVFFWFSVSETGFTTRTLMRAWIYCNWYNIRHQILSLLFFSYHKLKLCCGYLLLACLSKLPHQHLFYSNAWHSLSNTGKHTS